MAKHAVLNHEQLHISYRVFCKDCSVLWVNLSAYPAGYAENGTPLYYAIFSNATSQFNLYQDICDNSDTGIAAFDAKTGGIYYANDVFFALSGCKKRPYTGMLAKDLFGDDLMAHEKALLGRSAADFVHSIAANGKAVQFHVQNPRSGNQ
ncbi:MAG: hypothetical protein PHE47_03420 [Oscillospiraceae bacterium]|nr:hypothetical protein [Oscillospiraceae bacterium]